MNVFSIDEGYNDLNYYPFKNNDSLITSNVLNNIGKHNKNRTTERKDVDENDPNENNYNGDASSSRLSFKDVLNNEEMNKIASNKMKQLDQWKIWENIINSIDGKDKLSKIIKYSIDLTIFILQNLKDSKISFYSITKKISSYQILSKILIVVINKGNLLKLNIISKHFLKIIINKLRAVSYQIGTYRYILRFGNSPFIIYKMIKLLKVRQDQDANLLKKSNDDIGKKFKFDMIPKNTDIFKNVLELYFSVCDELMLLYRFGIWSNTKLFKMISKHEVYAWQFDIFLNLNKHFNKWQSLNNEILEKQIEWKIKQRNNLDLLHNAKQTLNQKIIDLQKSKQLTKLDLIRLSFDLMANSTDFFNVNVSQGTYSILSLSSAIAAMIKIWLKTKQEIIDSKTK